MNKRKIGIIVLAVFIITAVAVYAAQFDSPSFSGKGTRELKVKNPNSSKAKNATLSGVVCVTFEKGSDPSYMDVPFEVPAGETKTYSVPGIIDYWSTTYCSSR